MRRVMVIGPCGAGKSTLAFQLAERLSLPLYHLDQLKWQAGWIEGSIDDLRTKLAEITATERWLIDGNYGGTLTDRLKRADTVVYLDFPIRLCLSRLIRRIVRYHGKTRPDMTEGCPERFDPGFLIYVLRWNSGPRIRTERRLKGFEDKIIRLKSPLDLANWLDRLAIDKRAL